MDTYDEDGDRLASAELTLRDYFAAKAMQAMVTKYPPEELDESIARAYFDDFSFSAYAISDAMLKARKQ